MGYRNTPTMKRRTAVLWVAVCALAVLVGVAGVAGFRARTAVAAESLPTYEAVRAKHRSSDVQVFDRHGVLLDEIRTDFSERRGQWLSLDSVSPAVLSAVLVSEDRRFHDHVGVDGRAVAAAARGWLFGSGRRGASTITMQLASMLDPDLQRPHSGRGLEQKARQMWRALQLETVWTKSQILEAYLNLAAFRGELRGIDALSRVMFRKHPHGISKQEAAVAAALLRGPNADAQTVVRRACGLLVDMREAAGTCRELERHIGQWLSATSQPAADIPRLAPHFSRYVASQYGELLGAAKDVLQTTLDATVQRTVIRSVARHLAGMRLTHLTDAAVVVLDNRGGEVLAYVGGSPDSTATEVDHARALRQAGSTLKPFLYALALEHRYLTAASLLNDAALDVSTPEGLYIPANYDSGYAGWVSVRAALASSLNIPAVRTLMIVGLDRFSERLRRLGLPLAHDADHYGYSLSLGSADVDLVSLTNAYRMLARGESIATPVCFVQTQACAAGSPSAYDRAETDTPENERRAAMAAWIIGDILSDRGARARSFGLENALATRFWSAVKTGTSKDMRDNWAVGWSSDYTVGVWVGNSRGKSMREVSGVTGAAPIWHEVMSMLHVGHESRQPLPPKGLERSLVGFEGVLEASRREYFLAGTTLARVKPASSPGVPSPEIIAPVDGTIIALDPDMPDMAQRLRLRAQRSSETGTLEWYVDGQWIGSGPSIHWAPAEGRHTIALRTDTGRVLDEVRIQVRGLPRIKRPNTEEGGAQGPVEPTVGPEIATSRSD